MGVCDSVPSMGRPESYHEAIDWHPGLTLQQRDDRAPFHSGFAAGHAEDAPAALDRARHEADAGAWVLTIVEEQAVWACLAEGMSVRTTADKLSMTKSAVGRIAKRLGSQDDRPGSRPIFPAGLDHLKTDVRSRVRAAWRGSANHQKNPPDNGQFRN